MLSWSSGKDSAWTLYKLQQREDIELVGLFCTINQEFDRVAMHAVRRALVEMQAERAGLPIDIIEIPYPCSNEDYEKQMSAFVDRAKQNKVEYFAFGDLYLEDIRRYREEKLQATGIQAIFPLWNIPTNELSQEMIEQGLKARISCIDPKILSEEFCGREFDCLFLNDLPENVDPCGENGEFHSFVFDGPMFQRSIDIAVGETVHRDGFVFSDLICSPD